MKVVEPHHAIAAGPPLLSQEWSQTTALDMAQREESPHRARALGAICSNYGDNHNDPIQRMLWEHRISVDLLMGQTTGPPTPT